MKKEGKFSLDFSSSARKLGLCTLERRTHFYQKIDCAEFRVLPPLLWRCLPLLLNCFWVFQKMKSFPVFWFFLALLTRTAVTPTSTLSLDFCSVFEKHFKLETNSWVFYLSQQLLFSWFIDTKFCVRNALWLIILPSKYSKGEFFQFQMIQNERVIQSIWIFIFSAIFVVFVGLIFRCFFLYLKENNCCNLQTILSNTR